MKRNFPPNAPRYTAVALIVLGLIMIYFAWEGTSDLPFTQAQIPYLISGGLSGLALIATGLVLVRVVEARKDSTKIVEHLERLTAAVEAQQRTVATLLGGGDDTEPEGLPQPRVSAAAGGPAFEQPR